MSENLDMSGQGLLGMPILPPDSTSPELIDFSNNRIQCLDAHSMRSLDSVRRINLSNNQICRIVNIKHARLLRWLNLSCNRIVAIEGVDNLVHLQWLSLANNNIQKFPLLSKLKQLTYLDLSHNKLQFLPNFSEFLSLEVLKLSSNNLSSLESASRNLPKSVKMLDLHSNKLSDLTHVSFLGCLPTLTQLSITANSWPLQQENLSQELYRSYILCCCPAVTVLDGHCVTETETLMGEWLWSQGKGRQFLPGQHRDLIAYLVTQRSLMPSSASEASQTSSPRRSSSALGCLLENQQNVRLMKIIAKRREYMKQGQHTNWRSQSVPLVLAIQPDSFAKQEQMNVSVTGLDIKIDCSQHTPLNAYELRENRRLIAASSSPFYQNQSDSGERSHSAPAYHNQQLPTSNARRRWQSPSSQVKVVQCDSSRKQVAHNNHVLQMEKAAVKIQCWWKGIYTRTFDLEVLAIYKQIVADRIKKHCHDAIVNHDNHIFLTAVQRAIARDSYSENFIAELFDSISTTSADVPIAPFDVRFVWKDDHSGVLSWHLRQPADSSIIDSYRIFLNDVLCGDISNKKTKAFLTDLNSAAQYRVSVVAVRNGKCSKPSKHILLSTQRQVSSNSTKCVNKALSNPVEIVNFVAPSAVKLHLDTKINKAKLSKDITTSLKAFGMPEQRFQVGFTMSVDTFVTNDLYSYGPVTLEAFAHAVLRMTIISRSLFDGEFRRHVKVFSTEISKNSREQSEKFELQIRIGGGSGAVEYVKCWVYVLDLCAVPLMLGSDVLNLLAKPNSSMVTNLLSISREGITVDIFTKMNVPVRQAMCLNNLYCIVNALLELSKASRQKSYFTVTEIAKQALLNPRTVITCLTLFPLAFESKLNVNKLEIKEPGFALPNKIPNRIETYCSLIIDQL